MVPEIECELGCNELQVGAETMMNVEKSETT